MNETLISLIIPVYNAGPGWPPAWPASPPRPTRPGSVSWWMTAPPTKARPPVMRPWPPVPRIRVIHQANAGPAAARQTGLEAARGEWLCFVDGDDWLPPEYLTRLLALAREREATVAACAMCRFTGETPHPPRRTRPRRDPYRRRHPRCPAADRRRG